MTFCLDPHYSNLEQAVSFDSQSGESTKIFFSEDESQTVIVRPAFG
jgi:hypothetical protein